LFKFELNLLLDFKSYIIYLGKAKSGEDFPPALLPL